MQKHTEMPAMQDYLPSDTGLLDLLRKHSTLSVTQMAKSMEVTATAVRQRLTRLMGQGHVQRSTLKSARGRPVHRYELTTTGRRLSGANFADLAIALWEETRSIKDPEVRRGLLERISKRLAAMYADQIEGETLEDKMRSVVALLADRRIPFEVDTSGLLPILKAHACPYPELAERDRSVCAMERIMFTELLGQNVRLNECRLDGGNCCTFEPSSN